MTEAVAPARRALPPGGVVPENYFDGEGGAPTKTSLLDLFEQGKDTLFICSMMFPRAPTRTRRAHRAHSCSIRSMASPSTPGQRINVAVVVKTALPRALEHAEKRGGSAEDPLVGGQHVQPRLPRRDRRRTPASYRC
jgi:predicted dithiol-disulfide oxidoreductase (DUF899 family)